MSYEIDLGRLGSGEELGDIGGGIHCWNIVGLKTTVL